MKRLMTSLMLMMFLVAMPMLAFSMSHEDQEKGMSSDMKMEHGDMKMDDKSMPEGHQMHMEHAKDKADDMHKEHGGHGDMGGMQEIGVKTEDGVKAVAKIMPYDPKMAEMAGATHHFMVFFTDDKGNPITKGMAAVKVKGHDGSAEPVELMPMGDGFGSDLKIGKGHLELEVGTKLEDGKKRKFEYHYMAE